MEELKLILNKQNPKMVFCFLCFKENEKNVNIDDYVEITNENSSIATSLRCISEYLFPYYDIITNEACENCTNLIIEMYTVINKGIVKIKTIQRLTENLFNELESKSVLAGSKITFNLQAADMSAKCFGECYNNSKVNTNRDLCRKTIKPIHCKSYIEYRTDTQCKKITPALKKYNTIIQLRKSTRKTGIHKCNECVYKTSNKQDLKAHVNKTHMNIRPFICNICKKGFFSNKNLKEHCLTHEKDKDNDMVCDVCGERFSYRKTLMIHMRTHINHRPYSCETCDHRFVTLSQRNEHLKRKHGTKQFICKLCAKKYSLHKDLKRHLKNIHKVIY